MIKSEGHVKKLPQKFSSESLNVWLEVVISKLPANTSSDGLEGSYKKSL
jgi:hypothetical protein